MASGEGIWSSASAPLEAYVPCLVSSHLHLYTLAVFPPGPQPSYVWLPPFIPSVGHPQVSQLLSSCPHCAGTCRKAFHCTCVLSGPDVLWEVTSGPAACMLHSSTSVTTAYHGSMGSSVLSPAAQRAGRCRPQTHLRVRHMHMCDVTHTHTHDQQKAQWRKPIWEQQSLTSQHFGLFKCSFSHIPQTRQSFFWGHGGGDRGCFPQTMCSSKQFMFQILSTA